MSAAFLRDITENIRLAAQDAPTSPATSPTRPPGWRRCSTACSRRARSWCWRMGRAACRPGVEGFGRVLLHATRALFARGHRGGLRAELRQPDPADRAAGAGGAAAGAGHGPGGAGPGGGWRLLPARHARRRTRGCSPTSPGARERSPRRPAPRAAALGLRAGRAADLVRRGRPRGAAARWCADLDAGDAASPRRRRPPASRRSGLRERLRGVSERGRPRRWLAPGSALLLLVRCRAAVPPARRRRRRSARTSRLLAFVGARAARRAASISAAVWLVLRRPACRAAHGWLVLVLAAAHARAAAGRAAVAVHRPVSLRLGRAGAGARDQPVPLSCRPRRSCASCATTRSIPTSTAPRRAHDLSAGGAGDVRRHRRRSGLRCGDEDRRWLGFEALAIGGVLRCCAGPGCRRRWCWSMPGTRCRSGSSPATGISTRRASASRRWRCWPRRGAARAGPGGAAGAGDAVQAAAGGAVPGDLAPVGLAHAGRRRARRSSALLRRLCRRRGLAGARLSCRATRSEEGLGRPAASSCCRLLALLVPVPRWAAHGLSRCWRRCGLLGLARVASCSAPALPADPARALAASAATRCAGDGHDRSHCRHITRGISAGWRCRLLCALPQRDLPARASGVAAVSRPLPRQRSSARRLVYGPCLVSPLRHHPARRSRRDGAQLHVGDARMPATTAEGPAPLFRGGRQARDRRPRRRRSACIWRSPTAATCCARPARARSRTWSRRRT